jgi:hypothetical protein
MNSLAENDIHVLQEALDDEYRSWATYDQVIRDFGDVQPFSNIREAEARHIEALQSLFVQYAAPVPENPWLDRVARYANLQSACEAAAAAEIANGEMYDRLLGATRNSDVAVVLRNLQEASRTRHLPAFQRCTQHADGQQAGLRHRRRGID